MQISAKADYAVRVMLEVAAHGPALVKSHVLIEHQALPRKFVETILVDLRRADGSWTRRRWRMFWPGGYRGMCGGWRRSPEAWLPR